MEPMGIQLAESAESTVFLVDYGETANCNTSHLFNEIAPSVGSYVAEVIYGLNLNPDKVEIIGHSLGTNIASHAAAAFSGRIGRITGWLRICFFFKL